jgi:hypothetical protein
MALANNIRQYVSTVSDISSIPVVPDQSSRRGQLSSSDVLRMRPELHELLRLLAPISQKWDDIGIALRVDRHIIERLRHNETDNIIRLSEILQVWMDKDEDATWETVIQAIEGPIVDNKALDTWHWLMKSDNMSQQFQIFHLFQ